MVKIKRHGQQLTGLAAISFIDFLRDIGKYFTVNYMMSKESVKKRIENWNFLHWVCLPNHAGYDFFCP